MLDEDWLVLSTVHSAKGLEWQSVHLLAVYDGNFPADMAAGSARGDRRGAAAALRRAHPRAAVAAAYVPPRYHHRPAGRDDAHGYGRPRAFLTTRCRRRSSVRRTGFGAVPAFGEVTATRRVEVSVDELFA